MQSVSGIIYDDLVKIPRAGVLESTRCHYYHIISTCTVFMFYNVVPLTDLSLSSSDLSQSLVRGCRDNE